MQHIFLKGEKKIDEEVIDIGREFQTSSRVLELRNLGNFSNSNAPSFASMATVSTVVWYYIGLNVI